MKVLKPPGSGKDIAKGKGVHNILKANEAVERLRYNQVNNQISFHTEKGLECLKFVRRDRYE